MNNETFFVIKGVVGILSVLLLTYHMTTSEKVMRRPQRMRYITLLGFAVVVAGGSARQFAAHEHVEPEHWGSMMMSVFLVVTAVVSIYDERKHRR